MALPDAAGFTPHINRHKIRLHPAKSLSVAGCRDIAFLTTGYFQTNGAVSWATAALLRHNYICKMNCLILFEIMMRWYLIYTKPKQEKLAQENLERQGYVCYLPIIFKEKLSHNRRHVAKEPLFPRYLFIHLDQASSGKSWSPIRSTKGVSRLVAFGAEAAVVSDHLIDLLQSLENSSHHPAPLFTPGEKVLVAGGVFSGIEGIYEMADGESRAMVLIEVLSRPVQMKLPKTNLRKIS